VPRRLDAPRVVYIHWNAAGASARASKLHADELVPTGANDLRPLREHPPDAIVIDLTRRPSAGRDHAMMLRRYATTRRVPLVFFGEDEKARTLFPDATHTTRDLARAVRRPGPANPVVHGVMDAYAGASLARKLGVRDEVLLLNAPNDFDVPGARVRRRGKGELVVQFVRTNDELARRWPAATAAVGEGGNLWIAWPKRASGIPSDCTQATVRRHAMDRGWVDNKVAALDETYSALRLKYRG
jgi:hypothetical protein